MLAACGDPTDPMVREGGEDGSGEDAIPWERLQGTLLVTSVSEAGGIDLRLVDVRQRTVRTVATGVTTPAGPSGAVFSLAPDLERVAYAEVSGGRSNLRSIPIGSDPVECSSSCGDPLVATEGWEWGPAWSADGRLAYNASGSGTTGIVVDGELAHGDTLFSTDFVRPAWAPDGTLIAPLTDASTRLVRPNLYRLDPETRRATLLIPDVRNAERHLQEWAVSPTDGRLAYSSDQSGGIWVANPDGQTAVEVAGGYGPVWSPDGSTIAFVVPTIDDDTGQFQPALHLVDVAGGTPVLALPNATVRDWR